MPSPEFALDGGEEAEIVGLYLIGPDARPRRLGFALGNEFSDHVTERQNYLYLAHSKLRPCSVGPALRVGPLPDDVRGTSRIHRDGRVVWEKPFASGEANMCHDIANLEFHHFKYAQFLRPGDVHLHFFGAAVLSFVDGFAPASRRRIRDRGGWFRTALAQPPRGARGAVPGARRDRALIFAATLAARCGPRTHR